MSIPAYAYIPLSPTTKYTTTAINLTAGVGGKGGTVAKPGSVSSDKFSTVAITRAGNFGGTVPADNADAQKSIDANSFGVDTVRPIAQRVTTSLVNGANSYSQMRAVNKIESVNTRKELTAYRKGSWRPFVNQFLQNGTYSQTTTAVTVTAAAHGFIVGDIVKLVFTSGTGTSASLTVASVTNANVFVATHTVSVTASGDVTITNPAVKADSLGQDDAATPTRAIPGKLTYSLGKAASTTVAYSAKT